MATLRRNILVNIDALLDTRLTTLEKFLTNEQILELLSNTKYHERLEDKFPNVDKLEFRKTYKARKEEVLENAVMTNMVFFIKELMVTISKERINEPFRGPPSVYVNFHPYNLSEEAQKIFCEVLATRIALSDDLDIFDFRFGVENVNLTDEEISPSFILDKQISYLIHYEGLEWMEANTKEFEKDKQLRLRDLTLFSPALYIDFSPDDKEIQELFKEKRNPLAELEFLARAIVNLSFIDVNHFSVVGYIRKPEPEPEPDIDIESLKTQ